MLSNENWLLTIIWVVFFESFVIISQAIVTFERFDFGYLCQFIFRANSHYLSIIFPNVTIPCDVKPLVTMAVQLTAFIKVLLAKVAVIIMNRLLIKCDVKNHYLSKYYSVFIWFECLMSFIISSLNKSFVCLNSWLLSSSHEHLKSNYNSSLQPESNTFQHPQVLICKKGFIVCYAENSKFEFDKTFNIFSYSS